MIIYNNQLPITNTAYPNVDSFYMPNCNVSCIQSQYLVLHTLLNGYHPSSCPKPGWFPLTVSLPSPVANSYQHHLLIFPRVHPLFSTPTVTIQGQATSTLTRVPTWSAHSPFHPSCSLYCTRKELPRMQMWSCQLLGVASNLARQDSL